MRIERRDGSRAARRSVLRWTAKRSASSSRRKLARKRSCSEGREGRTMVAPSSRVKPGPAAEIFWGAGKIKGLPESGAARQGDRVHQALSDASTDARNAMVRSLIIGIDSF